MAIGQNRKLEIEKMNKETQDILTMVSAVLHELTQENMVEKGRVMDRDNYYRVRAIQNKLHDLIVD